MTRYFLTDEENIIDEQGALVYEAYACNFTTAEAEAVVYLLNHGYDHLDWEALEPFVVRRVREQEAKKNAYHPYPGFLVAMHKEIKRAEALHGALHSHHEAYAVLLEEIAEAWAEVVKKPADRDLDALHTELVQIAAVAERWAELVLREKDQAA